jgi:hypothetical protein
MHRPVFLLSLFAIVVICERPQPFPSSGYEDVLQQCYDVLDANLCEGSKWGLPFRFYRPSVQKYSPDQWLWDSGAHMIVWSHRNASNSVAELRTLLQLQRADGFVPEEIFWAARTQIENDELLLQWSNSRHSDITQYPVLPFALRAIHDATADAAVVAEFLPRLVRNMQWWRHARDDGDGLVRILHNWEGLDASPAYADQLSALHRTNLTSQAGTTQPSTSTCPASTQAPSSSFTPSLSSLPLLTILSFTGMRAAS